MSQRENVKSKLIDWNIKFPLDRDYRKARNIVFGSEEHRKINQIDLYFQYLEDILYIDMYEDIKAQAEMEKEYKAGKWLKDTKDVEGEEADDLFAKLKVEDISNLKIED